MRSGVAWVAVAVLAGTGVFWWQRTEIVGLRRQVAQQGDALSANQRRLEDLSLVLTGTGRAPAGSTGPNHTDAYSAAARDGERRVILDEYSDVLARLNLPEATAARLQDLLVDRVEAVLDAQDAAVREGFAEGSSEAARAVALAVAEVDRQIVGLVGPGDTRRLDGEAVAQTPIPVFVPQPAAPTVVVNVVEAPEPASPDYSDSAEQPAPSDTYSYLTPYLYYPLGFVSAGTRNARAFFGGRGEAPREHRVDVGRRERR